MYCLLFALLTIGLPMFKRDKNVATYQEQFDLGGAYPACDVPADWKPAKVGFAFKELKVTDEKTN